MEITSSSLFDDDEWFGSESQTPSPILEKTVQAATTFFLCISVTASLAPFTKTKKTISIQTTENGAQVVEALVPAPAAEEKEPIELPQDNATFLSLLKENPIDEKKSLASSSSSLIEVEMNSEEIIKFPDATQSQITQMDLLFKTIAENSPVEFAGAAFVSLFSTNNAVTICRNVEKSLEDPKNPIHPLTFLATIPKNHIKTIIKENSSIKLMGIKGGIERGMRRERGRLDQYLPHFSKHMNGDAAIIKVLIESEKWDQLLHHLFVMNY